MCFAKNKSEGRRLDVVDARAVEKNTCHSTCQYIIGVLFGGIVESLFPLVLVQEPKWRSSCRKKRRGRVLL